MTWTGKIIGDDSAWGDGPGADMALVVGDPAAPGEPLPGKLIPEAPGRAASTCPIWARCGRWIAWP